MAHLFQDSDFSNGNAFIIGLTKRCVQMVACFLNETKIEHVTIFAFLHIFFSNFDIFQINKELCIYN